MMISRLLAIKSDVNEVLTAVGKYEVMNYEAV